MIQSIIHSSENDNLYLYNNEYKLSMLIHPELKKAHESTKDIKPYYVEKYNYLKKHGFFSTFKNKKLKTEINKEQIKECLVQTPQILFEVTDFCNLDCTYCALGKLYNWEEERQSKNIDIEKAISLLKFIINLKLEYNEHDLVISFYGGEPLLNFEFIKQIVELSQYLNSEQQLDIRYSMTTNAVLIDKYIDYLVDNNFNILISLDGDEENNSYRLFRGSNKNSFKKIINNLDAIKEKHPKFFDLNISFNAVLHNKNSVKSIYEFIYNRYSKIPQISEMNNSGINSSKKDVFYQLFRDIRESESNYNKEKNNLLPHNELIVFHELTNFLKHLSINSYISDIHSLLHKEEKYFPASSCFPFSKKIFLTTKGTLLPCERISYKYLLGKVNEKVEIDLQKIADQYSDYYKYIEKKCQNCYIYRFCGLCMFHINNFDNLEKEIVNCELFHDRNKFQIKLYRIFSFLEKYPEDFFNILENSIIVS